MKIEIADWDSAFFGYRVEKIVLADSENIDSLKVNASNAKLIYVFSNQPLTTAQLEHVDAKLVDTKLLLNKFANNTITRDDAIVEWNELNDSIIDLAIQSGWYSRFKLDTNFKNSEFEKMYTTWISQSIESNETKVYGYLYQNKLAGFITLSTKNGAADIGLIAVDETVRGKNIGTKLIAMADVYAQEKKLQQITVNTQEENITALKFYIKNGFEIKNRTYIYHIWK